MNIYKPCDIRGVAGTDLTPELYHRLGRGLGTALAPRSVFVVGGDVRESTPPFKKAVVEGLREAGMTVLDLGVVPTPMVYFAKRDRQASACAIVTASHNPPHMNGLKWMIGTWPPSEPDVEKLRQRAASDHLDPSRVQAGSIEKVDTAGAYVDWLRSRWGADADQVGLKVLLDPGAGCWAGVAEAFLKEIFPAAHFEAIHNVPDGRFPDRDPDCAPQHLERLSATVREHNADLGVAFDGDGDRAAFVDNEGFPLVAEQATWVLLQSFGAEMSGHGFVHDVKFSDRMGEAASALGGRVLPERSGHGFIRRRMIESHARFGAEISGHYFFDELEGGDDGLFTACRLISYLAGSGRTLADLRRSAPRTFVSPEIRLAVSHEIKETAVGAVAAAFEDCPISFVDGVRVDLPGGWALIRESVTEPKLTCRFEARGEHGLPDLVRTFCERLGPLGDQLREAYTVATRGGLP